MKNMPTALVPTGQSDQKTTKKEKPDAGFFDKDFERLAIDLPASVQDGIKSLPQSEQKKLIQGILGSNTNKEEDDRIAEISLKLLKDYFRLSGYLSFDMIESIFNLCFYRLEDAFYKSDLWKKENYKGKIKKFLDTIWNNRGKEDEEVEIYQADYYNEFYADRKELFNEIKKQENLIKTHKLSIEKTKRQKRLTDSKNGVLRKMEEELLKLKEKLKDFESEHGDDIFDFDRGQSVGKRKQKELVWTKTFACVSEYYNAEEFAVKMSERLEECFLRLEKRRFEYKNKNKYIPPDMQEIYERDSKIYEDFLEAVEDWSKEHEGEEAIRSFGEGDGQASIADKKNKLRGYFQLLYSSYLAGKKRGDSDIDQNTVIRQMEVGLHVLKKMSNDKKEN